MDIQNKQPSHTEFHSGHAGSTLNWLRAAVLGANDGIVSTASLVVGVAGASNTPRFILTAGIAGLVAGALSMGVGEYISVSAQRDTEKALLEKERQELIESPDEELEELIVIYQGKGLQRSTAEIVAAELTSRDAFAAHVDAELRIDPEKLVNPLQAAFASALAFVSGAVIPIIPIIAIIALPAHIRIAGTFVSVIVALFFTGVLSANAGGASRRKAALRVVTGGFLAMIITFGIGKLFGVAGL
jgi:VIT1/CCC1 family predicted Fe2+/Mn2+ transporter